MHLKNGNHQNNQSLILAFKKIEAAQGHTKVLIKIDDFPSFTLIDNELRRIKNN